MTAMMTQEMVKTAAMVTPTILKTTAANQVAVPVIPLKQVMNGGV